MPPIFLALPARGKQPPVLLPHYFSPVLDMDGEGWPQFLLLLPGFGLPDPAAGYWHGLLAANDESS